MTIPASVSIRICAAAFALLMLWGSPCAGADKPWPPLDGVPMTSWGKTITMDTPVWQEYPRPQLVRERWLDLNGPWDFAEVVKDAPAPTTYGGRILVPFPPQAVLSQVGKAVDPHDCVWYHRTFEVPAGWAGHRILLHFEAVDWESHVWVNGKEVGSHTGGYDRFTFDITDALHAAGVQDLVLSAWNPVERGQPRGKQSLRPGGIFYTPTSGIWQTVWIEPVAPAHIVDLKEIPDVDGQCLHLTVSASQDEALVVDAVVSDGGTEVSHVTGKPGAAIRIPIPKAKLWWPGRPFLYDLRVTLLKGGAPVDKVGSYFGMRKISIGPDAQGHTRMLLNNEFVFEVGFLDQGFWPDGIYTAPSDAALRSDLEATKELGLNMLRKHIKVEPDRWYYWADKLGVLIWQDMPSSTEMGFNPAADYMPDIEGNFASELRRMVRGRINHPCIVVWVTFNEGWGLSVADKHAPGEKDSISAASKARIARMVKAVREEDPSRLIDSESGAGGGDNQGANFWDVGLGDILDFHCYGGDAPSPEPHRASVIGETGWGLAITSSLPHFLTTAATLCESAIVITQLTDVENETNGALRYDRTPKEPLAAQGQAVIKMMHDAGYANYPGQADAAPGKASGQ